MGRAAMLTYVHFNKCVMDRSTKSIASAGKQETILDALDEDALDAAIAAVDVSGAIEEADAMSD
eukprot:366091-Chlamydomonas_euryale.AAC.7